MKKAASLILALALCLTLAPAARATVVESGYCGDPDVNEGKNVTWSLDDAGTLTFSGTGKMADYRFENGQTDDIRPWKDYRKQVYAVVFEGSLTYIGEGSFRNFTKLTDIALPKTVTSIGKSAFYGCKKLKTVTIGKNVTKIGAGAFSGCKKLVVVKMGSKVSVIGDEAFYENLNFDRITLPRELISIGDRAFYGCSELLDIKFPEGLKSLGQSSFERCSKLTGLYIPDSIRGFFLRAAGYKARSLRLYTETL